MGEYNFIVDTRERTIPPNDDTARADHWPILTVTPREPLLVPYTGKREIEAPMTLGQLNVLEWFEGNADMVHAYVLRPIALPENASLEEVATAFGTLLSRHEGLRSAYVGGDLRVQRVPAAGAFELAVLDATLHPDRAPDADSTPPDPASLRGQAVQALLDFAGQAPDVTVALPPLQAGVVVYGKTVLACVVCYSHLAVDYRSVTIIEQELDSLIRTGAPPTVTPVHQPVDRTLAEQGPKLRRQAAAALRRWERILERMPQCLYATASTGAKGDSEAVRMRSVAAAIALRHIVARTRVSRPAAVLAAFTATLAQRTGYRRCEFPGIAGNRTEPQLAEYVGTLAQATAFSIDAGADSFDRLARNAMLAGVVAERNGCYDIFERSALAHRIDLRRGIHLRFEPVFNARLHDPGPPEGDRPPGVEAMHAAMADTDLRREQLAPMLIPLRFDLWQLDEVVRCRLWSGDTSRVDGKELESILHAVEDLLVAAARADLDRDAMADAIGLEPIERGPGWLQIDSCWVELDEVQRMLAEVVAPGRCRVVGEAGGRQLTAYVATEPGAEATMPGQLHERCVAALLGLPTAIAPRYYVICAGRPDDLDDLAGWRRLPVLAEGDGRSGS